MSDNSETVSKKKRGRPRLWASAALMKGLFRDVTTERGILNKQHAAYGGKIISEADPELYEWLQGRKPYPEGVFREVGMLALGVSKEHAVEFAREFRKGGDYKTWKAAARSFRLGEKDADPLRLANAIIKTVNDYWKRFPKLTKDQIEDALRTAHSQVIDAFKK